MITRRMLVIVAALLCSATTFAQSNQLRQSATQLAAEATSFAEFSYNDYGRTFRNTGSVDAVMSAHQFSAAAQLFNRMANDRRRNQDLNEAFQFLQNSWRSANRPDLQGRRGSNIEGLMSRIAREINSGNDGPIPRPFPDQGGPGRGSGRMTWRGTVDDDVRIRVRGGTAEVETIGGSPYNDAVSNFTAPISRRANVTLLKRRGRGDMFIEQQPSRENDYTAVVRIRDPRGGADTYEFDLNW